MLEAGDKAPLFTLPDQNGDKVALEDFRGTPLVLYFYPKDGTPGCTAQACHIRDGWGEFQERGVAVIGVSPDPVERHAEFTNEHGLPHTLLADPEHEVMEQYGAWGEKNMYGKVSVGPIRSTVLIDGEGRIVKRWKRVQAAKHAEQVLKAVDTLL